MSNQKQNPYTQSSQVMQKVADNSPTSQINAHRDFLTARLAQIQKWVTQGVKPEAIVRYALMDLSENKKLRECTQQSIYLGLLACAVTGLEPGALKGEAYLVPFAGKAQFMPGWKGLVKQARRSHEVEGIVANVVRERDTFDLDLGTANTLIHKPAMKERGDVVGAYAIAKMKGGHFEIEWMDRDELNAIQQVAESRGKSPAWSAWEDQMQRKSPIRRLCKRLPMGADYFVGLQLEEADDQARIIDMQTNGEVPRGGRGPSVDFAIDVPADQVSETTAAPAAEGNTPKADTKPAETKASTVKPAEKSQSAAPVAAPASTAPASSNKGSKYTAPKAVEKPVEMPRKAEVPPDEPPPKDGYEDRNCASCGVVIEVPTTDPAGGRCYVCKASED